MELIILFAGFFAGILTCGIGYMLFSSIVPQANRVQQYEQELKYVNVRQLF